MRKQLALLMMVFLLFLLLPTYTGAAIQSHFPKMRPGAQIALAIFTLGLNAAWIAFLGAQLANIFRVLL
jgi:hypothetical protein